MKVQELADFHGVSLSAVHKWSTKTRQDKTTQALAGAEPQITNLIGEINQLAYVFDCQNLQGEKQVQWSWIDRTTFMLRAYIFKGGVTEFEATINLNAPDALPRLLVLKKDLTEMAYGESK